MAEKKFLYYVFLVTIILVALIGYFLTYPLVKKINTAKQLFQNKQVELVQLQKKEKSLEDLNSNYKNFQEKIDMLNKMIPNTKDVSDYLTQLETASRRNNVQFKSIKATGQPPQQTQSQTQQSDQSEQSGKSGQSQQPSQTQDKSNQINLQLTQLEKVGDLYEFPMEVIITSKGDQYQNVISFVETLEKLSRFTSVKKVATKANESDNSLETSITLSIYVLP